MRGALASTAALVALVSACSDEPLVDTRPPAATTPPATPTPTTPPTPPGPTSTATPTPTPTPEPEPLEFEAARAAAHVQHLAGRIGPRLATGSGFRKAASYVGTELAASGYDVRRQSFPVPGGDSWGVPVDAGRSFNVVATPAGFDPGRPYRLVGAHLDTIAVAPGAEDNASGVAVLLELGRVLRGQGQVVLVAFGAEEPVGADDLHHFGSKFYVVEMTDEERRNLAAMVSLDRVGVGGAVPLASFSETAVGVRDELARMADRLKIPNLVGVNTTSDHESFVVAGLPAARIGSTDYAEYHSADDLPSVVQPAQLERVGRLLSAWLREPRDR